MLSQQSSPLPLRLSPLPPPPPPPLPEVGIDTDFDPLEDSSESDWDPDLDSDSDSERSLKKQKVNEEGDEESREFETEKALPIPLDHSSCCKSSPDSDDEFEIKDRDCWNNYFQQRNESQGFDIKDYPGALPGITVFPMPFYLEYPAKVEEMKGYAATALKKYNEKFGTEYEVNEILKVNGDDCGQYFFYYITFTVMNGEKEYFQAKVVWGIGGSLRSLIVRPRANGASGIF